MNIWLVEPYYGGSHRAWADGYRTHSQHTVRLWTLPGRFWKWRMQGGAITLAKRAQGCADRPDLIIASSMLNLPIFLTLLGDRAAGVPVALYFHENQLTYPLRPGEKRDLHYGFIQMVSALRADAVFFNSAYHQAEFLGALPNMLKHFPDYNELWVVESLKGKSAVLPLGLDLASLDRFRPAEPTTGQPLILWNHRWEYDKNPGAFLRAVHRLADEGLEFGLLLLGRSFRNTPKEFLEARRRLSDRILHFGYVKDRARYALRLWQADIVVSTALHDFFGTAVVEACYCDCYPVLPHDLAYPELIPDAQHETCLYEGFEGLLARLRWAISNLQAVRAVSLTESMARFDWRHMAPIYDARFETAAGMG
jgi:glycosyltransferase involved in cell wall biosynthesis